MSMGGFTPRTVDKVERLLDLMEELGRHPDLEGKLAMHGGTAINLFMLDVPRLSVDIDLSYIGAVEREKMLADRPRIENGIEEVARFLGYSTPSTKSEFAGRTFKLGYRGDWGPDQVKIDCVFLNRSPLTTPAARGCAVRPGARVVTFSDGELAGGKVKAFFDRVKVRDLYDICNLDDVLAKTDEKDETFTHRTLLFYASLSARFPRCFEGRTKRFEGKEEALENELFPMLRLTDERPTLQVPMTTAERFISTWVAPRLRRSKNTSTFSKPAIIGPSSSFPTRRLPRRLGEAPSQTGSWKI